MFREAGGAKLQGIRAFSRGIWSWVKFPYPVNIRFNPATKIIYPNMGSQNGFDPPLGNIPPKTAPKLGAGSGSISSNPSAALGLLSRKVLWIRIQGRLLHPSSANSQICPNQVFLFGVPPRLKLRGSTVGKNQAPGLNLTWGSPKTEPGLDWKLSEVQRTFKSSPYGRAPCKLGLISQAASAGVSHIHIA